MTPSDAGFVREPEFDHLVKSNPGWEVWRTPEGVLLSLPPGCTNIKFVPVRTPLGETLVCIEPAGVHSLWPYHRKEAGA